jgi:hypothetical protein
MPVTDLKEILQLVPADYLFCVMLVNKEISEMKRQIQIISKLSGETPVLIAGIKDALEKIKLPPNIQLVESIASFGNFVKSI